jgi:hypothetical protein
MRSMIISSIVAWLIILNVLLYVGLRPRSGGMALTIVLVSVVGVLDLILIGRLRIRVPAARDAVQLASEVRAAFFLAWALASSVILLGFVGAFIAGRSWIFAIALPFGALSLAMISPSRAALEHDQTQLRAVHSKLNLLDALMLTNGEVPQRIKNR